MGNCCGSIKEHGLQTKIRIKSIRMGMQCVTSVILIYMCQTDFDTLVMFTQMSFCLFDCLLSSYQIISTWLSHYGKLWSVNKGKKGKMSVFKSCIVLCLWYPESKVSFNMTLLAGCQREHSNWPDCFITLDCSVNLFSLFIVKCDAAAVDKHGRNITECYQNVSCRYT